jgi:hypothetical protein
MAEKATDFQIQLKRSEEMGWISVRVITGFDPIGNGYAPVDQWYADAGAAGRDAQRLRERLTKDGIEACVRLVRRSMTTEVIEER